MIAGLGQRRCRPYAESVTSPSRLRAAALLLSAAVLAGSCGGGSGITVEDAWSFRPPPGQIVSAAYGIVSNGTDADVTIVAASSPVAGAVELHETVIEDGAATMRRKDGGFTVPAGESLAFEPGGPHFMLLAVDPATYPDEFELTVETDAGDQIVVTVEVRDLDG